MEATVVMKCLVSVMVLLVTVQADIGLPPEPQVSDDSPSPQPVFDPPLSPAFPETPLPSPSLPPSAPTLSLFSPPVADPPIHSCHGKCHEKCADKGRLARKFCFALCMVKCKFLPFDHAIAKYHCTRNCVIHKLHRNPDVKHVDNVVNSCYSHCLREN